MNPAGARSYPISYLYVGDLHPDVTEAMLVEKFSTAGPVNSIRICRDMITRRSLGHANIYFQDPAGAQKALDTMNFDVIKGRPIRIMWLQRDPKLRKSGVGNVVIKNLDKSINNKTLYDAFSAFGNILSCKIVCDEHGSRGYGFVHFETEEAARLAIEKGNGMLLNQKKVIVDRFINRQERLEIFDDKMKRFNNVYVKNFGDEMTEEKIKGMFKPYGNIASVKAKKQAELEDKFERNRIEKINRYQEVNFDVTNFDDKVDDERLRTEFAQFGTITSAKGQPGCRMSQMLPAGREYMSPTITHAQRNFYAPTKEPQIRASLRCQTANLRLSAGGLINKMTYQLFLRGVDAKTISLRISEDANIAKIRRIICEQTWLKADDIRMFFCDKELRDANENGHMHLFDYKIRNKGNMFLVVQLSEGSNRNLFNFTDSVETKCVDLKDTEYRILDTDEDRSIKIFNEIITESPPKLYGLNIELTSEPDMITLDDSADRLRARMPCGHAIGPESLTTYCRTLIANGEHKFKCPHANPPCCHIWEFETIKRFAVLTDDEMKEFEVKIAMNYLNNYVGIHECPQCKSLCERKSTNAARVICPICTRKRSRLFEFCWFCRNVWLSSSDNDCGNANCLSENPRKKILREAPLTVINGVKCPSKRACPKCGWIIEHIDGCNNMVCRCTHTFCFICLKVQCGASNVRCSPATCQTE